MKKIYFRNTFTIFAIIGKPVHISYVTEYGKYVICTNFEMISIVLLPLTLRGKVPLGYGTFWCIIYFIFKYSNYMYLYSLLNKLYSFSWF